MSIYCQGVICKILTMKKLASTIVIFSLILFSCKKEQIEEEQQQQNNPPGPTINLKASIGLSTNPNDTDSICSIPLYLSGDMDTNGIQVGENVYDFTLYDSAGSAYHLRSILEQGKPVFLMSGSYTCPVFRRNIDSLNALISSYENDINFYLIYIVEPHPDIDISPYSGNVWTTTQNQNAGILFQQPKVYSERKNVLSAMLDSMAVNCPVLLDGPCNEYWINYGEAPNRAYLIDQYGEVKAMHGWFNYNTMVTSIDAFLASN